jgi:hypothetical protein
MKILFLTLAFLVFCPTVASAAPEETDSGESDILQPQPLDVAMLAEEGSAVEVRDPFDRQVKKIFADDYGKIADGCRLHGILRQAGKAYALLAVGVGQGGTRGGKDLQLRRVAPGEEIRVQTEKGEYLFKLESLHSGSVKLSAENGITYTLYI